MNTPTIHNIEKQNTYLLGIAVLILSIGCTISLLAPTNNIAQWGSFTAFVFITVCATIRHYTTKKYYQQNNKS